MLANRNCSAIVAVHDIERARFFYQDTLGLPLVEQGMDGVLSFRSGGTQLMVYRSQFAGTNQANAVTWDLQGDLDAVVEQLESKGVMFEHYAIEGAHRNGHVHETAGLRLVWLKDPDGNILHLMERAQSDREREGK